MRNSRNIVQWCLEWSALYSRLRMNNVVTEEVKMKLPPAKTEHLTSLPWSSKVTKPLLKMWSRISALNNFVFLGKRSRSLRWTCLLKMWTVRNYINCFVAFVFVFFFFVLWICPLNFLCSYSENLKQRNFVKLC